jgi:hypothetical protein
VIRALIIGWVIAGAGITVSIALPRIREAARWTLVGWFYVGIIGLLLWEVLG